MNATELIIIAAIGTAGLLIGELQQYIEDKRRHKQRTMIISDGAKRLKSRKKRSLRQSERLQNWSKSIREWFG